MALFLHPDDLTPFATIDVVKAQQMIEDAEALALMVAPCLADAGFAHTDAVRAILRGAVLRWQDSGSGARTSRTVGPYGESIDTTKDRRGMFWPSEISDLQKLCSGRSRVRVAQAWAL